ncbi:MAG: response regulator, partial [Chloroflexi bacterium]|nr:response regulator [Chloroflexota bacterium]
MVTEPATANGAPLIPGTSIPIDEILTRLAKTLPQIEVNQLAGLKPADVKAALEYAANMVRQQTSSPIVAQSQVSSDNTDLETSELDLKKILIVDDLPENRLLLEYMFKDSGYTLSMAVNAKEALTKARTESPILIISDIQMPGLSGFDLLAALKGNQQTKNIAVILVTAHHRNSNMISQGLNLGADDYIVRPFLRDEFLSRVEATIRVKKAEVEIQRQARMVARRNKRLQLVNELALAVNSSLNLQAIFPTFLPKLAQLLQAELISLMLLNEEKREVIAHISLPAGQHVSNTLSFDNTAGELQKHIPVIIRQVLMNSSLDNDHDFGPDIEAIQFTPMLSKDHLVGAIAFAGEHQAALSDDQTLLQSAAGIIAVAIENVRLLESTQQQVDDLIALNEIGRALTSTLDLDQILRQTTQLMHRSLQSEAASLWLLNETNDELVLITSSGIGSNGSSGYRSGVHKGIADYVVQTGEPYISGDISQDEHHFEEVARISNYIPRSILSVPIQVKGRIIGVMQALHQKVNWFDQDDLNLTYSIVSSVGIAVENARLFGKVRDFSHHMEHLVAERTRQLAEENEKTDAILASMADGLLVLDAEHRILTANMVAENMLEFRLGELRGQPLSPKHLEKPLWHCIQNMSRDTQLTTTALVDIPITSTKTVRSIQAHSAKVRNEEAGQAKGTVIVLRDITALKEVERLKARFVAGVTHELKTPLSVIRLHSKNLLTYYDRLSEHKRVELLKAIQTQTQWLEQLIENILHLSRFDVGLAEIERGPLNWVEVIDRIITNLRPLAEAKQITLNWQKPGTELMIIADQNQMEQVVRNLVDNAIKFTGPEGSVTIQIS